MVSLFSCIREDVYDAAEQEAIIQQKKEIIASCAVTSTRSVNNDSRGISSRGIIGQETVAQLDANFIKLDEVRIEGVTGATYVPTEHDTWYSQQTKLVNASVFSSPDNTQDIHFRSVTFSPRQTYQIDEVNNQNQEKEIVGYISRMVGWYPRTYEVPVNEDGVAADVSFVNTDSYKSMAVDGMTYDCVVFKNKLDGETDVMMTDMREGRYDLSSKGFKNNDRDRDIQPYGHMMNGNEYIYCNYFSFKHYLTAVRLYIKVENSDLSLISWKQINDIVFLNQPQTVTIALPKNQNRGKDSSKSLVSGTTSTLPVEGVDPEFGEPLLWEDETNMPIIKTAMAENDSSYPEFAEVPSYPLTVDNTVSLEKTYMGYILLRPDQNTDFEIHTDAGVYRGTIPANFVEEGNEVNILEAGNIYNIVVDMKADGSLDMVVGNEDTKSYRDLTPYNSTINDFEYSNCFLVSQNLMKKTDSEWYDGFYFQAMVPGCGERGSITGTGADLYPKNMFFTPHSARILWQDVPYLVTHVELVHGYIRFTLNDRCKEGLQGNAVLAALDENGDIIWSWHVWVNNGLKVITYSSLNFLDPENSDEYGDDPYTITPRTLTDVDILNMNLGATKASWSENEDPLACYGLYYQWGRKDPSPLPPSYDYEQSDMTTKLYYYMDEGEKSSVYRHLELYPTVETGALYPLDVIATAQISETYPNDWLYTPVDQLWGYSPSAKKVVKKTIYDPCPYGYRVADDELFALFYQAFTSNEYQEVDGKGIKITVGSQDNYFPFSGWRGHDRSRTDKTNAWYNVGNLGDYQDARVCKNSTTYKNHRGRSFLIRSNLFVNGEYKVQDVSPAYKHALINDYANRSSASPVRCVRYQGEPLSMDTGN